MSKNWVKDIATMHHHYGVNTVVDAMPMETIKSLLQFRIKFLEEELNELKTAADAENVVDALVDLCVVAIGTLDLMKVDAYKAWNVVHRANMKKQVGIKESRPNPLGLPDLIKPKGWRAPNHKKNCGRITLASPELP